MFDLEEKPVLLGKPAFVGLFLPSILVLGIALACFVPVFAKKPPVEKPPKPYSKQIYLSLPAYLEALEKPKLEKKAAKEQSKALKKAEKQAKSGQIVAVTPAKNTLPVTEATFVRYQPYQPGKELDLWLLEAKRFFRSEPVLSPDRTGYSYSEVAYLPFNRQTFSRLFWVPLTPLPEEQPVMAEDEGGQTVIVTPVHDASYYQDRLNPDKTIQIRQELLGVGNNRPVEYEFRTLTIIDWSANSRRLLFKQRSGVLHVGLKVSDLLVYDRNGGTVTIFPELQRVLQHYWLTNSTLPDLDTVAWDIYPIGWAPGSDSVVVFKAWAYDNKKPGARRAFLGTWQYDIDLQRSQLLSKLDEPYPLPANGIVPDFITQPTAQPVLTPDYVPKHDSGPPN